MIPFEKVEAFYEAYSCFQKVDVWVPDVLLLNASIDVA